MDKFADTIPLDEALRLLDAAMSGIRVGRETLPVREARGRTVLADQHSVLDLPAFDKSAMDGFAVLAGDDRDEYRLLETIPAGHVGTMPLTPGMAVKVMTGAAVPEGTGKVIMVEHAQENGDTVRILKHDGKSNISRKGEDVRVGDVVIRAGTVLGSLEIANLISCGIMEVEAAKPVRVAVIATGDEIVDSPALLGPGKIMNSDGPMLSGLAADFGLELMSERKLSDNKLSTEAAIRQAMDEADIVILSGGVSVGEFDYVLDALADIGLTVHFSRVAVKPGKPTVFATTGGKAVFGLPGNPVSVFLMFHLFVLRAAALMSGAVPDKREFRLRLACDMKKGKADRLLYVPARLTNNGTLEPVPFHGSAHLAALTCADGFVIVSPEQDLRTGDEVRFMPIDRSCGVCGFASLRVG
ncbi:MAG: molybdopterin molybdotransferase MoeA [Armatimonadetes bacterium]|nr:molybdopterin molybdotransferase MoeA [Armatimonadota bacterium]